MSSPRFPHMTEVQELPNEQGWEALKARYPGVVIQWVDSPTGERLVFNHDDVSAPIAHMWCSDRPMRWVLAMPPVAPAEPASPLARQPGYDPDKRPGFTAAPPSLGALLPDGAEAMPMTMSVAQIGPSLCELTFKLPIGYVRETLAVCMALDAAQVGMTVVIPRLELAELIERLQMIHANLDGRIA